MTVLHSPVWQPLTDTRPRSPRRPPEIIALVAMDLAAVLLCLIGVVRPPSPDTPVVLDAIAAVVGVFFTVVLLAQGCRLPRIWVAMNLAAFVALTAAIVSRAGTGEGAASSSMSFLYVALYVAAFFPRPVARVCTAVLLPVSGLALLANGPVGKSLETWLPLALALVVATEVLAAFVGRMRELTLTDALTGVLNRGGFEEHAVRERAVSARTGEPLSLVVIDIDDFKSVNDRYGHAVGDALLADIAAEWRATLRARDVIGRRGGDEFALILPETTEDQARRLTARLQSVSPYAWSYGVSSLGPDDDIDECLARADRQMYRQKRRSAGPLSSER